MSFYHFVCFNNYFQNSKLKNISPLFPGIYNASPLLVSSCVANCGWLRHAVGGVSERVAAWCRGCVS